MVTSFKDIENLMDEGNKVTFYISDARAGKMHNCGCMNNVKVKFD